MGNSPTSAKEDMSGVEKFVEEKIKSTPVVVFSKTWCGFCRKAKSTLEKYGIPSEKYEIIELDQRDDEGVVQDYLRKITGARSVPRVFIGGKCIGGGDETVKLDKEGKLGNMLKDVQAIP